MCFLIKGLSSNPCVTRDKSFFHFFTCKARRLAYASKIPSNSKAYGFKVSNDCEPPSVQEGPWVLLTLKKGSTIPR